MANTDIKNKGFNNFFLYIILAISFSYLSCEELTYSPSGDNYHSLEPPDIRMEINLEDIGDTTIVWGTTTINYKLDTYGKEFNSVELYLDSQLVARSRSLTYLVFDSENFPDGNYHVVMLLSARSGSGSLADKMDLEYVVLVKEFVMTIQNNTAPVPITISTIETSSGYAKLTWPKYTFSNFESYKIFALIYVPPYNYSNEYIRATIENRDSTVWIDDAYTGGKVIYTIDVVTVDGTVHGEPYEFESGAAKIINWEAIDTDSIKFTWQRCETDSTFGSYELYKQSYPWSHDYYTKIASINDINDTVVIASIEFGSKVDCFIKTISNNEINQFYNSFSPLKTVYIGHSIPEFKQLEYIQATNSIYLSRADSSFRLDATTNQLLAKGKYGIDVCFDGTRGYAFKDLSQVVEIDPVSLNEIRSINLQDLLIGNDRIDEIYTGKQNIIYCNTQNEDILMIDVDAHEIVSKRQLSNSNPNIYQSSPHGYLIHESAGWWDNGNIFKVDLSIDSIVYSGLYVQDYQCISFSYEGNLDIIIDTYASRIWTVTHNGIDYVTFDEFNIPEGIKNATRDPITGLIGGFKNGSTEFVIYNVNSHSEVKRLNLSSFFEGKIFLFDSKVYSTNGTYMSIN